jgi:hypothetical protein
LQIREEAAEEAEAVEEKEAVHQMNQALVEMEEMEGRE